MPDKATPQRNCIQCIHVEVGKFVSKSAGECHLNPPAYTTLDQGGYLMRYPHVCEEDWCSHFELDDHV